MGSAEDLPLQPHGTDPDRPVPQQGREPGTTAATARAGPRGTQLQRDRPHSTVIARLIPP
ncbi:conserved hypothetical protein [Ricinus communis]|uniref:Uncharacterized protein n=1 Tax=Ricinus communis TaxID=3988 RepID=B9TDS1_RICCO|nr:conserved hypothetical protein [Ricinus communis]